MSDVYAGGCACGANRYEITGEPVAQVVCQCRQCQRQSGTGHGAFMTFVGAEVTTMGEPSRWQAVGDGGMVKNYNFCGDCGARLHVSFPDAPHVLAVYPGSLDEPERFRPKILSWNVTAQPWDRVDPAVTIFEKMPPQ